MIWESNADFVCLQEVIMPLLKHLLQNHHITNTYYISTTNIEEYGVMMLFKGPVYFYKIPFENSLMDRSLLLAETTFNN